MRTLKKVEAYKIRFPSGYLGAVEWVHVYLLDKTQADRLVFEKKESFATVSRTILFMRGGRYHASSRANSPEVQIGAEVFAQRRW